MSAPVGRSKNGGATRTPTITPTVEQLEQALEQPSSGSYNAASPVCHTCLEFCEVEEVDEGGYEEVWGAPLWVSAWVDLSTCCGDEASPLREFVASGWPVSIDVAVEMGWDK